MESVIIRVEIFKENGQYVAVSPELNVSSFGNSPEEAKASLSEAVSLFFEECERMKTLNEVLEEAGFIHLTEPTPQWVAREPLAIEELKIEHVAT